MLYMSKLSKRLIFFINDSLQQNKQKQRDKNHKNYIKTSFKKFWVSCDH